MMISVMNLVDGPNPSKRFGPVLEINLLGSRKVCSFDCAYCSLGPTELTMNAVRKGHAFPTAAEVEAEFKTRARGTFDVILVSGNGDPTLHVEFEEMMKLILRLRDHHAPGRRVVVLTNGAHLDQKKVVAGLNLADERVVKIDAGNDKLLQRVNQPLVRLTVSKFLGGFRKLSPFLVQSLFVRGDVDNCTAEAIDDWLEVIGMVKPQSVQLTTLDRPAPTLPGVRAVDEDTLYGIAFRLKKRSGIEAKVFLREG